jgi:transcriptional regulator with PAS, ATPase and Fis domain
VKNLNIFAQNCAEAISNALEVEAFIIDKELIRIAGTGKYGRDIGQKIPSYYLLPKVFETGECLVEEKVKSESCNKCPEKDICDEKGSIAVPIMNGSNIVGAIALTFITEKQWHIFTKKKDPLLKFVKNMAELLASKIKEDEFIEKLEVNNGQLNAIFSSVNDGILLTGNNGIIINCSDSINKLVKIPKNNLLGKNIKDVFEGVDSENSNNKSQKPQLNDIKLKEKKETLLKYSSPIIINNVFKGEIVFFNGIKKHRFFNL